MSIWWTMQEKLVTALKRCCVWLKVYSYDLSSVAFAILLFCCQLHGEGSVYCFWDSNLSLLIFSFMVSVDEMEEATDSTLVLMWCSPLSVLRPKSQPSWTSLTMSNISQDGKFELFLLICSQCYEAFLGVIFDNRILQQKIRWLRKLQI